MIGIYCNIGFYSQGTTFSDWEKRYDSSIIESVCRKNSVSFIFECLPNSNFLRVIEKEITDNEMSLNDIVKIIYEKIGMSCRKIGNSYHFTQEKFIYPPVCSASELYLYIGNLEKILRSVPLHEYTIRNGKLHSLESENIQYIIDEILKISGSDDFVDTRRLSELSCTKLELALKRNYFSDIKSFIVLWSKILKDMSDPKYSIAKRNEKFILSPTEKNGWGSEIAKDKILVLKNAKNPNNSIKNNIEPLLSSNIFTLKDLCAEYETHKLTKKTIMDINDTKYIVFGKNNSEIETIIRACAQISDLKFVKYSDGCLVLHRENILLSEKISEIEKAIIASLPASYKRYFLNNGSIDKKRLSVVKLMEQDSLKFHIDNYESLKMNFNMNKYNDDLYLIDMKQCSGIISNIIMTNILGKIFKYVDSAPDFIDDVKKSQLSVKKSSSSMSIKVKGKNSDRMIILSGRI